MNALNTTLKRNLKPQSVFTAFIMAMTIFGSASTCFAHAEGHSRPGVSMSLLSSFKLGSFGKGAAEIVAYDVKSQQAFVTNSEKSSIDIISLSQPSKPTLASSINLKAYPDFKHGHINSVALSNGLVAVAIAAQNKQENGSLAIFDFSGKHINTFETGALPDMVTFTPNGRYILVANEGEPSDDYSVDPEGSITIIKVASDMTKLDQSSVQVADFKKFNDIELDASVRVFGKNATPAQDFEPEYITVSSNSKTAWVSLQENNAFAVIDIKSAKVTNVIGLGFKSFNTPETGIDASDKDNKINIKAWPVFGMYQPDSIASYKVKGQTYIVTANEGDARVYPGYSEVARVSEASIAKTLLKQYPGLSKEKNLGRLKISTANGDTNGDGKLEQLYAFGARSFSIWDAQGKQVYDSGSQFGNIIAKRYPKLFNRGQSKSDRRSDDKGVEPEALTIGEVNNQPYAFIGLERSSGIMAFNINNPNEPYFSDYFTNNSPALADDDPKQGDIAPESLTFISAKNSPIHKSLLLAANEISSTLSIYLIEPRQH